MCSAWARPVASGRRRGTGRGGARSVRPWKCCSGSRSPSSLYVYAGYPLLLGACWARARRAGRVSAPPARVRRPGGRGPGRASHRHRGAQRGGAPARPRIDNLLACRLSEGPAADHRRLGRLDRRHGGRPGARIATRIDLLDAAARRQGRCAQRRPSRGAPATDSGLRRRAPALRARRHRRAGPPFARPADRRRVRRADARLRVGDRLDDRRRRRRLLELREVAAPARGASSARRSASPAPSTRMRRSLWRPLPADTMLDDVLAPMRVVLQGYRVTFDERAHGVRRGAEGCRRRSCGARCGRWPATSSCSRTSRGCWCPCVNPVWLQFMSHKVGRLLVPYALLGDLRRPAPALAATLVLRAGVRRAARVLRARGVRRRGSIAATGSP